MEYKRQVERDFLHEQRSLKKEFKYLQESPPNSETTAKKYNKLKDKCNEFKRKL